MIRFAILLALLLPITVQAQSIVQGRFPTVTHGANPALDWYDANSNMLWQRLWFDPTATNSTGQIIDSSGLNHNPTIDGAPTWTIIGTNSLGRIEHAYSFDNTDDRIRNQLVSGSGTTVNGCTAITMTAWINITAFQNHDGICISGINTAPNNKIGISLYASGQAAGFVGNGSTDIGTLHPGTLTNGLWHFLCMTWASGDKVYLYCDERGSATSPGTMSGTLAQADTTDFFTGWNQEQNAWFSGLIDDVRIYTNKFISASEVLSIYNGTKKGGNSYEVGY